MKSHIVSLLIIAIILLDSCIVIRTRKPNDGSASLTKYDSTHIVPFCLDSARTRPMYSDPSSITFQVVDAEKIRKLAELKPVTWIFIGASWCPMTSIALQRYSRVIRQFPGDSLQWILLYQDFNIKSLQKDMTDAGIQTRAYLLDPQRYGTDESDKQVSFVKDLDWGMPLNVFKGGSVPKSIIVDQSGRVLYVGTGPDITKDTIALFSGLKPGVGDWPESPD